MNRGSAIVNRVESHNRLLLIGVVAVILTATASIFSAPSNSVAEAETVTCCQLLKTPAAFDGKRIRINGVYLYSFETQRLLPLSCCDDLDIKTWVNFGELDRKSRNLIRHFPQGTGMVLGTFVGRLDYGQSPNPLDAQFTLRITAVEKVEKVTKEIEKAAWRPPQCKQ